jgi:hypothetical protein
VGYRQAIKYNDLFFATAFGKISDNSLINQWIQAIDFRYPVDVRNNYIYADSNKHSRNYKALYLTHKGSVVQGNQIEVYGYGIAGIDVGQDSTYIVGNTVRSDSLLHAINMGTTAGGVVGANLTRIAISNVGSNSAYNNYIIK